MIKKAVFERITDTNQAIILVGEEEIEYLINLNQLPLTASEGDLLQVQLEENNIIIIDLDLEETEKVKKRINEKIKKLKKKSSSKFIKK